MPSVILAGTTSTTALNLTGDTSGVLQFQTNNGSTTAMTLTTAGDVGIGTASPAGRLEVNLNTTTGTGVSGSGVLANFTGLDAAAASIYSTAYGSNNGTQFIFRAAQGTAASPTALVANNAIVRLLGLGYNGSAFTGSRAEITIQASENWTSTANGTYIRFNTTADGTTGSTERMRINSSGNVGIGTSNPAGRLHVAASGSVVSYINSTNGSTATLSLLSTGVYEWTMSADTSLRWAMDGTERMRIDSSGNVGIGTSSPSSFPFGKLVVGTTSGNNHITVASGTTGEGTLAFADGTTGTDGYRGFLQYQHTSDTMFFGTAATERMRITSGGNVGIGTTVVRQKLTVQGAIGGIPQTLANGGNNFFPFTVTSTQAFMVVASWNNGSGYAVVIVQGPVSNAAVVIASSNSAGGNNAFDTNNDQNSNGGNGVSIFPNGGFLVVQTKVNFTAGSAPMYLNIFGM